MENQTCLVGDIGGTNARFAVAEIGPAAISLRDPLSVLCAQTAGPEEAIDRYLQVTGQARPPCAVIAIAGAVENGAAACTNGVWSLSEAALESHGFQRARLINDYAALAFAAPFLTRDDLAAIGPDIEGEDHRTIAVVGAGTGFGVAALARDERTATAVVTEGGHIAFAPTDDTEMAVLRFLGERFGRVSIERILSGPGLADLRWSLGRIGGGEVEPLTAAEIVARAETGEDTLCAETVSRFCAIYGSVAGDFALAFGARSGVLLAGGIAPRILPFLRASSFRERFEAKGRFAAYLQAIPSRVILHPYAALIGAASALAAAA